MTDALAAAVAELTAALDAIRQGDALAYTVDQAAARLNLSPASIRRLVARGRLARVAHTERVLISRVELERFASEVAA